MMNIWYTTEEGKKLDFPYYDNEMLKDDLEYEYWDIEKLDLTFDCELKSVENVLWQAFRSWSLDKWAYDVNEVAKKLDAFDTIDFRVLAALCEWFKFDVAVDMVTKQYFKK